MATTTNRSTHKRNARGRPAKRGGGTAGDTFRERLRQELGAQGITAYRFAQLALVPQSTVSSWLNQHPPRVEHLRTISEVLDVSADWLLGFDVSPRRTDREPAGDLRRDFHAALLAHACTGQSPAVVAAIRELMNDRKADWTAEPALQRAVTTIAEIVRAEATGRARRALVMRLRSVVSSRLNRHGPSRQVLGQYIDQPDGVSLDDLQAVVEDMVEDARWERDYEQVLDEELPPQRRRKKPASAKRKPTRGGSNPSG